MIPVNRPKINPRAKKYLTECIKTNWLSAEGPFVDRFEKAFARWLGAKYATTTTSGTTSLHLALASLGIGKGDEVILPALTIGSCYFAIWYCGAVAVPVDVKPETYNIDPALIEKKITSRTKAIMVVHLYGHPCDMDSIIRLVKKYHLKLIEDAAEACGAEYKNIKVGTFGDVSCFSFYANKIITTGEGGMLVTNNKKIYEKAKKLKDLNFNLRKRFIHDGIGFNYRMTNLQAAVGLAGLEKIDKSIKYKRKMADYYNKNLRKIKNLVLPVEKEWAKNVYWMYAVLVKEKKIGINRDRLMKILWEKYKIQTRAFFYPPNIAFKKIGIYNHQRYPVAERLSKEGLYLPSGLGNTFSEFRKVCKALNNILKKKNE